MANLFKKLFGSKDHGGSVTKAGRTKKISRQAVSEKHIRNIPSQRMSGTDKLQQADGETGPWYIGKTVGELFDIRDVLGRGGMGIVYLAHDNATQKKVAIKVPLGKFVDDEGARKRFAREAEAWTGLIHPHIVHAFDVEDDQTTDYRPAIFMDYCDGGSLKDRIYNGQKLSMPDALDIAIQVCWAMEFAHKKGYIHRDLKPSNVLLTSDGKALVTDFGLVKILEAEDMRLSRSKLTKADAQVLASISLAGGTPEYMPSEQWEGKAEKASDIYAFGIMLYELFCGSLPFTAESRLELRVPHMQVPPPEPKQLNGNIPDVLANLMLSCLSKRPCNRPKSFGELADRLTRAYTIATEREKLTTKYLRTKPQASEISRASKKKRAWALIRLGTGCLLRGDLDDAMRQYQLAASTFEQIGDKDGLQASLCNQATILRSRGKLEEAMKLLKKQEVICHQSRNFNGLQASMGNQAMILMDWGRLKEAMNLHQKRAAVCRERKNNQGLAASLSAQALVLFSWKKLEEAMNLFKEAETLYEKLQDLQGLQTALAGKAIILESWGKLDKAMELFERKERICHQLGYAEGSVISLVQQASLFLKMRRSNNALPRAEKAYRLACDHNLTLLASQVKTILEMCQNEGESVTDAVDKKIEELGLATGDPIRFVVGGDAKSPHHQAAVKALREREAEVINER